MSAWKRLIFFGDLQKVCFLLGSHLRESGILFFFQYGDLVLEFSFLVFHFNLDAGNGFIQAAVFFIHRLDLIGSIGVDLLQFFIN